MSLKTQTSLDNKFEDIHYTCIYGIHEFVYCWKKEEIKNLAFSQHFYLRLIDFLPKKRETLRSLMSKSCSYLKYSCYQTQDMSTRSLIT